MRAILIDPFNQTVAEVVCPDSGDDGAQLKWFYKTIGTDIVEAPSIKSPGMPTPIDVWCDEEGMLKGDTRWTYIAGAPQPYAGRLVLLSNDGRGNCAAAPDWLTVDVATFNLRWVHPTESGWTKAPAPEFKTVN